MKKIIIAIAAVASLGLAGCSGNSQPVPTVTVTEQAPQGSFQSSSEQYVNFVKDFGGRYGAVAPERTILSMGNTICDGLSAGMSTDDVIAAMAGALVENDMADDDGTKFAAALISGAEKFLCSGGL